MAEKDIDTIRIKRVLTFLDETRVADRTSVLAICRRQRSKDRTD